MNKTIEPTASSNSFIKYTPDILFYPSNKMKQQKQRKSKSHYDSSLPHISVFNDDIKNVKINQIRKESDNTEEQITLMKARLHAMKELKKKIQFKKQKSLEKVEFVLTVRQRKNFQSLQKLKEKQKKNQELQDLKDKAKQFRQNLKKQVQKAKQTLYLKNITSAFEKKEMQAGNSQEILKKQQKQYDQRASKVDKIKMQEQKHSQILREFQHSRIIESRLNRASRIQRQLKQKLMKQQSLQKLKKEHQQYAQELKSAEQQYDQALQKINPQNQYIGKGSRVSLIDKMIY